MGEFPDLHVALAAAATATLLCLAAADGHAESATQPLRFEKMRVSTEKFEAASVCDADGDGHPDIVSGSYWYAGPDFRQRHKICEPEPAGEYFDDFSDYPMDVNGDGRVDIVTGAFFGKPLRWRENPGDTSKLWTDHPIAHVGPIETTRFWDVDGDGNPEIVPNAGGNIIVFKLKRDASGRGTAEFTSHPVKMGGVGHGIGFGDINGDGRGDFIGPDGWFEAPEKPLGGTEWKSHPEFKLGSASVPILVHDVNSDGLADLIVGEAHNYGLYWMEQKRAEDGTRQWIKHMIDAERSQYHDLALADLDKDGPLELVTGKRYRAHNGHDPGANDPVGIYYFKINGGRFERVNIDHGPPDTASGAGIYFWIADVDGNGWLDIVAPGKEGLYLFGSVPPEPPGGIAPKEREQRD